MNFKSFLTDEKLLGKYEVHDLLSSSIIPNILYAFAISSLQKNVLSSSIYCPFLGFTVYFLNINETGEIPYLLPTASYKNSSNLSII